MSESVSSGNAIGRWANIRPGILNVVAACVGFFAFRTLFDGLSSEAVLSLASAWWLCLYVGRFVRPNWTSVALSVLLMTAVMAILLSWGLQVTVAAKSTTDVTDMLSTALGNGVLFSIPLVVNILADKAMLYFMRR